MKKEGIIHSGQFMSSHVHEGKADEEEEIDIEEDGVIERTIEIVPDTRDDNPVTFYKFGPKTSQSIAIDTSLTKLNKCLRFVYTEGVLYTPKWKHFQGLNIAWKDRVRLNNVIWRAWFMQFVHRVPPKYCFFSIPDEETRKPQLPIVEGMYWKRRTETVAAQYHRWRRYYAKRLARLKMRREEIRGDFNRSYEVNESMLLSFSCDTPPLSAFEDDDFSNWFTDTLFSNLSQPYLFPNPKEMAQAGNADIIQPGLVQLQPSLEEIMRTFDNVPEIPYEAESVSGGQLPVCSKKIDSTAMEVASDGRSYANKGYVEEPVILDLVSSSVTTPATSSLYETQVASFPVAGNFPPVGGHNAFGQPLVGNGLADASGMQYSMAKTWICSDEAIGGGGSGGEQPSRPAVPFYAVQPVPDRFHGFAATTTSTGDLELADKPAGSFAPAGPAYSLPTSTKGAKVKKRRQSCKADVQSKCIAVADDAGPSLAGSAYCKTSVDGKADFACAQSPWSSYQGQSSSQYLPHGCIVRPIPIALSRSEPSAFISFGSPTYPLSPLVSVNSSGPLASPQTSCSSMLNLYPSPPSGVRLPSPKSQQSMPVLQSSPLRSETPLLILQSVTNMQVPILPFSGHSPGVQSVSSSSGLTPSVEQLDPAKRVDKAGPSKVSSVKSAVGCCKVPWREERGASTARLLDAQSTSLDADSTIVDRSERKRVQHLQAEQFRRSALKNGFDLLEEMLFDDVVTTSKPTNAFILAKAAKEIRSLRKSCASNEVTLEALRAEVEKLNERVNLHQSSMAGNNDAYKTDSFEVMVRLYVKQKLKSNWKLWPLWQMVQPLYESYRNDVSGHTRAEVAESAREWLSNSCSHGAIRQTLSSLLVRLATDSPLLRDPHGFQRWVEKMIAEAPQ